MRFFLLFFLANFAIASPNIVFFITDDQSWDSLGFMGGKVHTPRLDQLAQEGMLLTDFNVTSTVCSPSRYSFLTGRYAGRCEGPRFLAEHPPGDQTQVENIGELEPDGWNIAKALQAEGYATGFVGKSHIIRHDWMEGHNSPMESYPKDADPRDPAINAKMRRNHQRWCREVRKYGFDYADGVYAANLRELLCESLNVHNLDWTVDRALRFLEANRHRPFFLCFSTTLHHGPAPWANQFSLQADPRMTGEGFVAEGFDVLPSRKDVLKRNREAGFKDRDAYALWLDDGVGAILDALERLGVAENTLFIFVPDHGSFRHGKATLYEYGMRVPMLLRWPDRVAPGSRYGGLVANIDLAPTLLDICGAKPPADFRMDGRSFKSALFGDPNPVRDVVFAELGHSRAVKTKDWKYIAVRYPPALQARVDKGATFPSFKGDPIALPYLTRNQHLGHYAAALNPHYFTRDQLFDIRNDREENRNLAKSRPEIVRELRKRLAVELRQFAERPFGEFTD